METEQIKAQCEGLVYCADCNAEMMLKLTSIDGSEDIIYFCPSCGSSIEESMVSVEIQLHILPFYDILESKMLHSVRHNLSIKAINVHFTRPVNEDYAFVDVEGDLKFRLKEEGES